MLQRMAPAADVLPCGHLSQRSLPMVGANVLIRQLLHAVPPWSLWARPGKQGRHDACPSSCWYLPASQFTHSMDLTLLVFVCLFVKERGGGKRGGGGGGGEKRSKHMHVSMEDQRVVKESEDQKKKRE